MDYLLSEGYPNAAQKFSKEANIQPRVAVQNIENRVKIRNLILAGNVEEAISRINDLNPLVSELQHFRRNVLMIICFMHHS